MKKHGRTFRTCRDGVAGIGIISIIIGCYQTWQPLAWLVGGACCVACSVMSHWMEPKDDNQGQ